jgi:predicted MPP superfamily phosphohydrolase
MNLMTKLAGGAVICAAAAVFYDQNNRIVVSEVPVRSDKIPPSFDGFRIAHLSDLHNKSFGGRNEKLLLRLEEAKPDIIVMTGDVTSPYRCSMKASAQLMEEAAKIAPLYIVSGNHESKPKLLSQLKRSAERGGAVFLDGKTQTIKRKYASVHLLGAPDPGTTTHTNFIRALKRLAAQDGYRILLTHRPSLIHLYERYGADLVFCGHAHGGQIQLPGIGGLLAPDEGFFPKYTKGKHTLGETDMIVSRGLGNSTFPFRLLNYPEIVVATLRHV